MIRVGIGVLVLLGFVGCGGDSSNATRRRAEPYVVNNVIADRASLSITISITVDPPATEANVKAAAEIVIAKHSGEYKSITVKSYTRGADQGGLPYATSMFTGDTVTHSFNPNAASQKIPTH